MNIVIRADSTVNIGSGHMMRCITLAEKLRDLGAYVCFICRGLPGNINDLARARGFEVLELDASAIDGWLADANHTKAFLNQEYNIIDWLIVDHYGLDIRWERELRPFTKQLMVIDDLADRAHDCDVLLDANYYLQPEKRYRGLVPMAATSLLGPLYALLRSEFNDSAYEERIYKDKIKRVMIFFGGSDPTDETGKLLQGFPFAFWQDVEFDVIVGASNPRKEIIAQRCLLHDNVHFYCQINHMAEMIKHADVAIGAGGTAVWERCFGGLPSIVIAVADNQVDNALTLESVGALRYLGTYHSVDCEKINDALCRLVAHPDKLTQMSRKAKEFVPSNGTEKIAQCMMMLAGAYLGAGTKSQKGNNVLVTSAAKKVPLLKSVQQSMGKIGLSGKLIAADSDQACIARYFADDFWCMPPLDTLNEEMLLRELQQHNIRYIIPTRDGELKFWSKKKNLLNRHGIFIMVSDSEAVDTCLDKLAFFKKCQKLHLLGISTAANLSECHGERLVVKERYGSGARQMALNVNRQMAQKHAANLDNPIFQPYITGKEYSIDAYVDRQGQVKGLICRSRDKIVNGESQVTTTIEDTHLESLCSEAIAKLGLYGHVILQVIVDVQHQVWLVECNARFGGASALSIAAGLDSFYWFFLEASGQSLTNYPYHKVKKQLRLVRYPQDAILEV